MFTRALVRLPAPSLIHGITSANLGLPDYQLALQQHTYYIDALRKCGLQVEILPAIQDFPDSVFMEDVALLTPSCGIITRPGAPTRRGEVMGLKEVLEKYYSDIFEITEPGTIEAGDIMRVGDCYYIGLSRRTNQRGADQLIDILKKYGFSGIKVPLKEMLHLKTGLAYLENNNLLCSGEFIENILFNNFNKIIIPPAESYAANCIWVNGKIFIPSGYPHTLKMVKSLGYETIELDMSEFRKLDGGLSCLSLRL